MSLRNSNKILFVVPLGLVFLPEVAHAYVDPGILSVLYQLGYIAVFGTLTTFILKPWRSLKSHFRKATPDKQSDAPGGEPGADPDLQKQD